MSRFTIWAACLMFVCFLFVFSATTTSFSLLLYFQVRFPTLFFYRVLESHKFIRTRKLICFFVLFCLPLQSRRRHRTGYFPRDHRRKNRIQINHKLKKNKKKYNTKMGNGKQKNQREEWAIDFLLGRHLSLRDRFMTPLTEPITNKHLGKRMKIYKKKNPFHLWLRWWFSLI